MIGSTVVNYQSDGDSEYDEDYVVDDTKNVSRKMPIVTQSFLNQPNSQLPFSGRNLKQGGHQFQARLNGQLPDIRSMITAEVTLINPNSNSNPFPISHSYPYPYPLTLTLAVTLTVTLTVSLTGLIVTINLDLGNHVVGLIIFNFQHANL